jgi:aconitate hydratase
MTASTAQYSARRMLGLAGRSLEYHSLGDAAARVGADLARLPVTLKILLENLLRFGAPAADVDALLGWPASGAAGREVGFRPARVLMQDFTGVPAEVDLAAMREAMHRRGLDPALINPLNPVDLVIDHSVSVDSFAAAGAFAHNVELEMERNRERYQFLRWGQTAFRNFRVVPPGTGICHQVNLEYLARVVWDAGGVAFPDTLVGTDSHTTMINGLGVLGWGVGGIEAEAAMLGQPVSMVIPEVVGFELRGRLADGVTATDLVLTVVEMLRAHGVVGKFVEFHGAGLDHLPLADRATIANMAPEYGATCGFFPLDDETLRYLRLTGREEALLELVERYARIQGMWRESGAPAPVFSSSLTLDLARVEPCIAGPKRPQDRVALGAVPAALQLAIGRETPAVTPVAGADFSLRDGDVVIAAITSCTNTSNPAVMVAAGLLAKRAVERGLSRKPWVKTSLAPGSKVVTDYLLALGLQDPLDALGFQLVGYGCTTCIGNSGPLPAAIDAAIGTASLTVCAVLSGNRNFEGRIHQRVRANWLASPPLVVAFALAGTMRIDLGREPLGTGSDGTPVYLRDIWPSAREIADAVTQVSSDMFRNRYADVFSGDARWQALPVPRGELYEWNERSTYIRNPPFFARETVRGPGEIRDARLLVMLGDSVTTDHISPAGAIAPDGPAADYLRGHGVARAEFNSYGARRGNHEVMMRGTFANVRLRNELVPGVEGGMTRLLPDGEVMPIHDAAMRYLERGTPLLVIAGREYGTGSSRDWAAKGTFLLGVRAVIAESFERIHRSNLVGMGVLPLEFTPGVTRKSLKLAGEELFSIDGLDGLQPGQLLELRIARGDGGIDRCPLRVRVDTAEELQWFRAGGILHHVLGQLSGQPQ